MPLDKKLEQLGHQSLHCQIYQFREKDVVVAQICNHGGKSVAKFEFKPSETSTKKGAGNDSPTLNTAGHGDECDCGSPLCLGAKPQTPKKDDAGPTKDFLKP